MQGLMQCQPLLLSSILTHAARHHGTTDVVTQLTESRRHRTSWAATERRARRLARVLERLGVRFGDRVATLAWNTYRHLELYYAVSGMGAICHTLNPRLSLDDVTYLFNHAEDSVVFADLSFVQLLESVVPRVPSLRAVVLLADPDEMPPLKLPAGISCHCYEDLMAASDEDYAWPTFDENTASALCYSSGTTGRPKGVLYSHRSAVLHAFASNAADAFGLRAVDRVLPGMSMFHATGWGIPYSAAMAGAALILPGRFLDPVNLTRLINEERVTFTGGVPTIWLGVLEHLQKTGARFTTLRRMVVAGSACPQILIDGFAPYDVHVHQAWGMTETSPIVTYHAPKPATADLGSEASVQLRLKQGRTVFGTDVKIVDASGNDLPWDGVAFGDLLCRGSWIAREYLHAGAEGAAQPDGWFRTGDVATIDPEGYVHLVDRSKDVIKSGGEWVSSIALENIAVTHPDVAEAAVIGAAHPRWMERPLLLVRPREGRAIDKASVLALYDGAVAKWWLPDDVVVVDELPHTATGKLNKVALRAKYADYLMTRGH